MDQAGSQINSPYDDVQRFGRILIRLIRTADKCIQKTKWDIDAADIPQNAIAAAPPEDLYLVKLYYAAQADLIITTDRKFYNAFAPRQDIDVDIRLRDDFLAEYLQQN